MRHQKGFTIVELLIVIVVIGILAAITIVAYNGIQTRANNSRTIQAGQAYVKGYGLYAQDNGVYPGLSGCLGDAYTSACLSQGTAECFGLGPAGTNATLNGLLKPYMNNTLPMPSEQKASCGTTAYSGLYTYYSSGTKVTNILMILKGNETCPAFSPGVSSVGKTYSGDATLCNYNMPAPS